MPKKAFVICYCRLCGDSTFQVVRELADSVFGLIGFRIRRFAIAHLNEKSKLLFHNYLYMGIWYPTEDNEGKVAAGTKSGMEFEEP